MNDGFQFWVDYFKGKKTYLIAAAAVILGFLQGMDIFTVPDAVWPVLGGLGLTTLRSGVTKVADSVKHETKANPVAD